MAKLEPKPAGDDAADVENSGEPKPLHKRVYSKSDVNVPLMRVFLKVVSPAPGEQGAGGDPRFPEKMTYAETADGFRISAPELVHESIDRWFTREGIPADEADGPADANLIVANGVTILLSGTSRDELEKLLWRTAEWNPQDRAEYDLTTVDHVTGVDNAAADILKDIQNPYGPLPEAYLRWTVPGERAVVLAPRAAHAMLHILFDEDSPVLQRERNKRAVVDPELHDALTPPTTIPPAAGEDAAAPSEAPSSITDVVRKMVNNAADVDEQLAIEDLRGFVVEFAAEADSKLVDRYVEVLESRGRPFKLHNDGDHVWIEAAAVAYPVEPLSGPATKELVLQQPADMSQADLKALAGDIRAQGYDCRVAMRRLHEDGGPVEGSDTPLLIVTVPADFNGRPVYETRMEGGRMRRIVRLVGTGVAAPPGGIGEPYAAPLRSPTAPASQTPTTPTTGEDAVDRYLAPDTGPIHLNVTKDRPGSADDLEILASRRYIINFAGDVPLEVVNAYVKRFEQSGDRQVFLHRAGNGYVLAVNAVRAKENNPEPPPQESATASGPFLTDRQQRVADAAYQILGWELEPLDGDERAAVKQAGYDGGLRVVGFRDNRGGALGGVILVGLHTSPIADFDDLGEFLARTDLPERSPVKYYWLARNSGGGAGGFGGVGAGPFSDSPAYQLVKNRVAIQQDAWAAYRQSLEPPRVVQTTPAVGPPAYTPQVAPPAPATPSVISNLHAWQLRSVVLVDLQQDGDEDKPTARELSKRLRAERELLDESIAAYVAGFEIESDNAQAVTAMRKLLREKIDDKLSIAPGASDSSWVVRMVLTLDQMGDLVTDDAALLREIVNTYVKASAKRHADSPNGVRIIKAAEVDTPATPPSPSPFPPGGGGQSGGRYGAPQLIATAQPAKLKPFDTVIIRVANGMPDAPIDDAYALDERGRVALGPVFGRVAIGGMTIEQAEAAVTKHLKKYLREPMVQITRPVEPTRDAAVPAPQQQLLYDGQTFEQWRAKWRYELKTDRRIEAIDALAAFARAGQGREAVEAILDVAAEYDFAGFWSEKSSEGMLKSRLVALLTSTDQSRVAEQIWLPVLLERFAQDGEKWGPLAFYLLDRLETDDAQLLKSLLDIACDHEADLQLRVCALGALGRSRENGTAFDQLHPDDALLALARDPAEDESVRLNAAFLLDQTGRHRDAIHEIVGAFVASDDARLATAALHLSGKSEPADREGLGGGRFGARMQLLRFPDLELLWKALTHPAADAQLAARRQLQQVVPEQVQQIATRAVELAMSSQTPAEQIAALRVLTVLGPTPHGEEPQRVELSKSLYEMAKSADDPAVKVAAVAAATSVLASVGDNVDKRAEAFLRKVMPDKSTAERSALLNEEFDIAFGRARQ
ncbi:MAG: hypothetical protein CMJ58_19920 [Planctomycetaceae bacterium]|nr:hypothetical protein [Planctomycetaceae bacterium]